MMISLVDLDTLFAAIPYETVWQSIALLLGAQDAPERSNEALGDRDYVSL